MNSQDELLAKRFGSQSNLDLILPVPLVDALITLHVFDQGRGESVVLLALPDARVIFGINSVDFCNIGQFRVML